MISVTAAASCRTHHGYLWSHPVRRALVNHREFLVSSSQESIRRLYHDAATTKSSSHPPLHSNLLLRNFSISTSPRYAKESPKDVLTDTNERIITTTSEDITATTPNFTLESVILALDKAAQFNQGKGGSIYYPKYLWDVDSVRQTVEQYEHCLKFFHQQKFGVERSNQHQHHQQQQQQQPQQVIPPVEGTPEMKSLLLRPETTERALRALLRCRIPTDQLSERVREWETYIGQLGETPITDQLSFRLLEANGKAGNIGRAMDLLSLRLARGYTPKFTEFVYAVTAIEAAGLNLRKRRNVFLGDNDQPRIDDPTQWLDAILINMSQRNFSLTTSLANRMLNTYASTGKTGKGLHFFYRVLRSPIHDDENDDYDDDDDALSKKSVHTMNGNYPIARFRQKPVKIRLSMRPPPPYHKIPSQVRGKMVRKPGSRIMQLKSDCENDPDWSPPLTAAITFADSLTQGACGHDPIELDLVSYSILIKACVYRGSLWRAMHILDEIMPSNGIEPDFVAYNTLLYGLANVGDAPTMKEYFNKMHSKNIAPTAETVEAIVRGLLNLGDVATAITVVQDCFNQYSVLPPYTTHLKILEVALGRGLVYEAKRHVYVIQQLWKWERNEYHSELFCKRMMLTQKNPKLSKEALKKLFAYFAEKLDESDFF